MLFAHLIAGNPMCPCLWVTPSVFWPQVILEHKSSGRRPPHVLYTVPTGQNPTGIVKASISQCINDQLNFSAVKTLPYISIALSRRLPVYGQSSMPPC